VNPLHAVAESVLVPRHRPGEKDIGVGELPAVPVARDLLGQGREGGEVGRRGVAGAANIATAVLRNALLPSWPTAVPYSGIASEVRVTVTG
jgi:hypothetical protein